MLQLDALLAALAHGETQADILVDSQITPDLLDQMMLDLVRGGYLERFEAGCASGGCSGCSLAGSCKGIVGWSLTERGKSVVQARLHK